MISLFLSVFVRLVTGSWHLSFQDIWWLEYVLRKGPRNYAIWWREDFGTEIRRSSMFSLQFCVQIPERSICRDGIVFMVCVAAAAKSPQSCPTLCDPRDGSPPDSPVPGILQARTLEWVAISFSNAGKWKVKVKSLSRVWLLATPWAAAHQAPLSMGFVCVCGGAFKGQIQDRGWDGWMASSTQWTWVWANSERWWRAGKPGGLQFTGSQRVGYDWVTE